ncbi:hypothetical protein OH76DRAFT_1424225 [Lentinus brumalis]|uniref:Uncharacterized protein n=1 Tax=Lentinus brumalis TaxID=2498619 RepID=A0A371CH39_9APHY|nr:hypothetical protein OH76DRAFT_1424225 [Polyporus brumalis]
MDFPLDPKLTPGDALEHAEASALQALDEEEALVAARMSQNPSAAVALLDAPKHMAYIREHPKVWDAIRRACVQMPNAAPFPPGFFRWLKQGQSPVAGPTFTNPDLGFHGEVWKRNCSHVRRGCPDPNHMDFTISVFVPGMTLGPFVLTIYPKESGNPEAIDPELIAKVFEGAVRKFAVVDGVVAASCTEDELETVAQAWKTIEDADADANKLLADAHAAAAALLTPSLAK